MNKESKLLLMEIAGTGFIKNNEHFNCGIHRWCNTFARVKLKMMQRKYEDIRRRE